MREVLVLACDEVVDCKALIDCEPEALLVLVVMVELLAIRKVDGVESVSDSENAAKK